jgi:hypothetical protein
LRGSETTLFILVAQLPIMSNGLLKISGVKYPSYATLTRSFIA